jgi:hypothetical protein
LLSGARRLRSDKTALGLALKSDRAASNAASTMEGEWKIGLADSGWMTFGVLTQAP